MEDCDLAFERSEVNAEVKSHIVSVKNPLSGCIKADSIGEIIMEQAIVDPAQTKFVVGAQASPASPAA